MPETLRAGRRIHYQFAAAGDHLPLVLLPGLGSGSKLFGTLPRRLGRDGFPCLTFDPLGIEPSGPLGADGWSFEAAAHDVWAVVDAAGLEAVDLVGTSLGGKLALATAALQPTRVRRLVLLASAAVPSARSVRVYRFFETVARHVPAEEFSRAVSPFLFGRPFHEARPQVVDDIARSSRPPQATRDLMVAQAGALQGYDGTETARRTQQPTLCVAGLADTLTDAADVRATADILPHGRYLELPRAGHSLLLEDAAAYRATVAFLGGGHSAD